MSYEIAWFTDGLLHSFGLFALALAVGGLVWGFFSLKAETAFSAARQAALASSLDLAIMGAWGLALTQFLQLWAKTQALADILKISPFPDFLDTQVFQIGLTRALLAAGLALGLMWLRRKPERTGRWICAVALAAALMACGAWLVHGASRMEDRVPLMALTAMHQFGAIVWVGGVIHLGSLWRLGRRQAEVARLWPSVLARFTPLGLAAVLLLLLTGIPLGLWYVDTWQGLIGTAYGSMLASKWVLMAAALGLAGLNFAAARRWRRDAGAGGLDGIGKAIPFYVESEGTLLFSALFVAASLAALPPSVDLPDQQATAVEVIEAFAPKIPRMISPTIEEVRQAEADSGVVARTESGAEEYWSDYNHNMAGIILLSIGLLAIADRTGKFPLGRHWPLGFLVLAVFVLIRADNEVWPYGDLSFLEGMQEATILQHRLAFLVTAGLGVMEWRARNTPNPQPWLPYVFPALCITGGIVLLTHSHASFEFKTEYLIEVSHTAMGVLALLMGVGRWLELRLDSPAGRLAGHGSVLSVVLIALILIFYLEPPA